MFSNSNFFTCKKYQKTGKIKTLYITPLRALNRDVFQRITKYVHANLMIIKIRHGDTSQKDRKKITADEKYKFDRAWKVASLVENFGKIAISVISGYGVGADTAAIMLRNMVDGEHLFKQIYEAERQYVVTRGFWDS